jgi:hypothetical protein
MGESSDRAGSSGEMTKQAAERKSEATAKAGAGRLAALAAVVCLCVCFVAAAVVNAWTTSATYDETSHLPSGYAALAWSDYRLNPEHPPLIKKWAALPLLLTTVHPSSPQALDDAVAQESAAFGIPFGSKEGPGRVTLDIAAGEWARALVDNDAQWRFGHEFLFGVKDEALIRAGAGSNAPSIPWMVPTTFPLGRADFLNDADGLLFRGRMPIIILGAALAIIVFVWSRRLFGLAGGILSLALFCFDPNFIAHSALVTTDVGVALFMMAAVYFAWRACERPTRWSVAGTAVFFGLAIASKFSALILLPILIAIGLIEIAFGQGSRSSALSGAPGGLRETGRGDGPRKDVGAQRSGAAPGNQRAPVDLRARTLRFLGVLALSLAAAYAILWASYGFRFAAAYDTAAAVHAEQMSGALSTFPPGREAGHFPLEWVLRRSAAIRSLLPEYPDLMPEDAIDRATSTARVGPTGRLMLLANQLHLAPEAYLFGLAIADMKGLFRGSYLLGNHSNHGWWYYFPVTFFLKTPLPAMAAIVLLIVLILSGGGPSRRALLFLLVPVGLYIAASMRADLNIGHRHLLVICPFLYVLCGSLAGSWRALRPRARTAVAGIALRTIALSSSVVFAPPWRPSVVFPHQLAFFNEIAGGPRNGSACLVDSNLDWGQDLPALKQWLTVNGIAEPIALAYFGSADPAYYRIPYLNLPGGYMLRPNVSFDEARPARYIAVSATNLRGAYYSQQMREELAEYLKGTTLVGTAGYSIFIYHRD